MTLRVLLVALVAAMGLELPGAEDFETWEKSSRQWATARMADLSGLCIEAGLTSSHSPDSLTGERLSADSIANATSDRDDLAFEVVSEAINSSFSADLALMESKPKVVEAIASVESEGDPATVVAPTYPDSRLDKISTAVRLTKQAVDAWASVIKAPGDKAVDDGRGDSF